jgi:dihydrofolate synthase / folylpolyglutamate synthase
MFTTYEETLNFLYENLPMFQRIGTAALKLDLRNTLALCEALGNPQEKFRSIHVAGTNGKGSTSHMLASILQSSGFKTGLYTSPHLKSFTERIRINGREISTDYVIEFVNRMLGQIESLKPSFFEITVSLALDYFARNQVDIAVIEVGLGGRLDSTNIITPEVSIITNIGWDHMDVLGDTLEKIAAEKAGIIKPHVPVVISERQPETDYVFQNRARSMNSPVFFASDHLRTMVHNKNGEVAYDILQDEKPLFKNLRMSVQGIYQQKNVLGVIEAIRILRERDWNITDRDLRSGLENVVARTGLKGRWQILGASPLIVCDTGHNPDGIKEVVRQIEMQRYDRLYFILGMVKGKDVTATLKLLPKSAYYFFCRAKIPRALDASVLFETAQNYQLDGEIIEDVNDALHAAKQRASRDDMIFIGGSSYIVAEIAGL